MADNVRGILSTGEFTASSVNAVTIVGNNNHFGSSAIPTVTEASTGNNPIPTDTMTELEQKVAQKLKALQLAGEEFPERELFRKKLGRFLSETENPELLADLLYEKGVLIDYARKKLKGEKLDYDKNDIIYNTVIAKRAIPKLLCALEESGNEHILKLIEELTA